MSAFRRVTITSKGPGKYDDLCKEARTKAKAVGAILFIIGGSKGNGLSVQATLGMVAHLPELFRKTADAIEAENKQQGLTP